MDLLFRRFTGLLNLSIMKTIMNPLLIINCIPPVSGTEVLNYRLGEDTVFDRVLDFALHLVPKESIRILTAPGEEFYGIKTLSRSSWTLGSFLKVLQEESKGYDGLIYVFGDCPFLDPSLAKIMLENHKRYFAEYTFADGYPYGLAPEIVQVQILEALEQLLEDPQQPIERDSFFTLISKDINAFDLETELSPLDLRYLRVSLTTDTRRNRLLCTALNQEHPRKAEDVLSILQSKPEILRTLPAYLSIQITEKCPQECSFCPYPVYGEGAVHRDGFMALESFSHLIEEGVRFCEDLTVGVSLWGEPAYYPDFPALCRILSTYPSVKLVVETSGVGWNQDVLENCKQILGDRVSWIVDLLTNQQDVYERLRGKGFEESRQTAETLLRLFPKTTYIQALRMEETEEGLEQFYRKWKERTPNLIIQKYDYFSGLLPQRKVTDISPLHRFPCWHLKRDLYVLLDGSVPLCREDIQKTFIGGNLFQEGIETIWKRMDAVYREHIEGKYRPLCEKCDEYYTYNF
jgi:spiro-SPASM protein